MPDIGNIGWISTLYNKTITIVYELALKGHMQL